MKNYVNLNNYFDEEALKYICNNVVQIRIYIRIEPKISYLQVKKNTTKL